MNPIPQSFFKHDAIKVAKSLLGKTLSYNGCSGMIVETEAYKADPASHAYRITPRSEIMLRTYGHWYVYFVYGMYHCVNITTNGTKEPGAVLIRSLEPLAGIEMMEQRRKTKDIRNLCSGPGKLCTALGIDKQLNGARVNGTSVNGTNVNHIMKVLDYKQISPGEIAVSNRIGIREEKPLPWRFFVKGSMYVSLKNRI